MPTVIILIMSNSASNAVLHNSLQLLQEIKHQLNQTSAKPKVPPQAKKQDFQVTKKESQKSLSKDASARKQQPFRESTT